MFGSGSLSLSKAGSTVSHSIVKAVDWWGLGDTWHRDALRREQLTKSSGSIVTGRSPRGFCEGIIDSRGNV